MATKAEEREWIAWHLYDEDRVERYRSEGYLPMWHELSGDEQAPWFTKAARLQAHLAMCRKSARQEVPV